MSEPLSKRELGLITMSLWGFASRAHDTAKAAALKPAEFPPGAASLFLQDATDAEALLAKMRTHKIAEA